MSAISIHLAPAATRKEGRCALCWATSSEGHECRESRLSVLACQRQNSGGSNRLEWPVNLKTRRAPVRVSKTRSPLYLLPRHMGLFQVDDQNRRITPL